VPIKKCGELPTDILSDLRALRNKVLKWNVEALIPKDICQAWDAVIKAWSEDASIPLIVRKPTHEKVCNLVDHPERKLAPSDNSPAHWVAMKCLNGEVLSLDEIKQEMLSGDSQIPMTMILSKREMQSRLPFRLPLSKLAYAGKQGWYLAHRKRVGLGIKTKLEAEDLKKLKEHFRRLMSPSNFFLIPKTIAALAELEVFFEGDDT
jgi:hypothetical protein